MPQNDKYNVAHISTAAKAVLDIVGGSTKTCNNICTYVSSEKVIMREGAYCTKLIVPGNFQVRKCCSLCPEWNRSTP